MRFATSTRGTISAMSQEDAFAARWFGVRGEFQLVSRRRMAMLTAREWLLYLVSWGVFAGDFDPKRFCDVIVFRRDTGDVVASFPHTHLGAATGHLTDLRTRLLSTQVFDFCRELGLSIDVVAGPGQSPVLDPLDPWVGVEAAARRT
jgi:hypothetical protein